MSFSALQNILTTYIKHPFKCGSTRIVFIESFYYHKQYIHDIMYYRRKLQFDGNYVCNIATLNSGTTFIIKESGTLSTNQLLKN